VGTDVMVRWLKDGRLFQAGWAFRRSVGDEDLIPISYAKSLRVVGAVEVIEKAIEGVIDEHNIVCDC